MHLLFIYFEINTVACLIMSVKSNHYYKRLNERNIQLTSTVINVKI